MKPGVRKVKPSLAQTKDELYSFTIIIIYTQLNNSAQLKTFRAGTY